MLLAPITAVYERIPPLFVEAYDDEFATWFRELKRFGRQVQFRFKVPVEPPALAIDRRRVVGAVLTLEVDKSLRGKPRIIIRPLDESAEEAIRRHTAGLARLTFH